MWLFLGLGCGLMLLLCCGGLVGSSIYLAKNAIQIADDPQAAKQQSDQIADLDLPEGFKADKAITVKNPVSGEAMMTTVIYAGPSHEPAIFVMTGPLMASADREQMRTQMEQQMRQQGQHMKNLNVVASREVETEIHGQPASFKIAKAQDAQTKQDFVQVEGVFEGKQGPAILIGQFKADALTEDEAEEFVKSIK